MTRNHLTIAFCASAVIAILSSGAIVGWRVPNASGSVFIKITKTAGADFTPRPTAPVFILAIGNDGRPGQTVTRADAIHLIGVNPISKQATILDFPRDTGLDIPGHGVDKATHAHVYGGPRLTAEMIGNAVGVPVSYAISTNFEGFIGMVNDMGGLVVNVPERMKDNDAGVDLQPGTARLSGNSALGYARNRKQFARGDLRRTENQGYLIISALEQLRSESVGPIGTLKLLANLGRHSQLEGIGLKDLYALGRLGLSIDPANVRNYVVETESGTGTQMRLAGDYASLFADFADDAVLQTH